MANNFLKNLCCLILSPILLFGFFISPFVKAQETSHLVISAVQITEGEGKTSHDFIEIYNPTDQDINLKGYRLVKRTKIGTSDSSIKSWTDDVYVEAHGWRLWASSDDKAYPLTIGADDATTATIAPDNGIAIRLGSADAGEIIDSVAWGSAENIFNEIAAPQNPIANEALIRKPGNGLNNEDTGNNTSDFFILSNYTPHNSGGYAPVLPSLMPTPSVSPGADSQNINNSNNNSDLLQPLVVEAGPNKEAMIGQKVLFDGSDSYDPEEKVLSYNWDFGDGVKSTGVNASHVFKSVGDFKVILKITSGSRTAEDFLTVKITAPEFSDKVRLSELMPDPVGSDKDGEWIEIYNSGDNKVNINGWILDDKTNGGSKPYIFAEDTFIEPKGFLVVPRSKSKIVLANTGGEVNLLWYDAKNLSKAVYGAAKEGRSFAFIDGLWQWTGTPSSGKANIPVVAGSQIEIKKTGPVLPVKADENTAEISGSIVEVGNEEQYIEEENQIFDETVSEEDIPEEAVAGDVILASQDFKNKNSSKSESSNNLNNYNNSRTEEKSNPWFWGDMALSVMSLFLVWRYQSLKKKVK